MSERLRSADGELICHFQHACSRSAASAGSPTIRGKQTSDVASRVHCIQDEMHQASQRYRSYSSWAIPIVHRCRVLGGVPGGVYPGRLIQHFGPLCRSDKIRRRSVYLFKVFMQVVAAKQKSRSSIQRQECQIAQSVSIVLEHRDGLPPEGGQGHYRSWPHHCVGHSHR